MKSNLLYDDNSINKILIAGLCGIGDLLFFIPTLKALRTHYRNAEIDLLMFPNGVDNLLERNDLINHFIIFPFEKYIFEKQEQNAFRRFQKIVQVILFVRKRKYELAIWPFAFTTFQKKALSFLFGAKANIIHKGRASLMDFVFCRNAYWIGFQKNIHNVKLNLSLLEPFNSIEIKDEKINISLSDEDIVFGKEYLNRLSNGKKKFFVGFHPGGKLLWSRYRQWEISKFADLADKISKRYNSFTLIFGTRGEKDILEKMANLMQTESVIIDSLSLREVSSIINLLDLFIGNDSALIHIAACLGIRSISITGPTNFERTGPWGEQAYVVRLGIPCSPCFDIGFAPYCPYHFCLKKLESNYVFSVIEKIINSPNKQKENFYPIIYNHPDIFHIEKAFPDFFLKRRNWESRHNYESH